MPFVINQTIDLSEFGWDGCTITLQSLSYKEVQDLQAQYKGLDPEDPKAQASVFEFVESKFVSGTAKNEKNEVVELKATDLPELPIAIFSAIFKALSGAGTSPNS